MRQRLIVAFIAASALASMGADGCDTSSGGGGNGNSNGGKPKPECDPNYEGACLDPNSPDYDCEGGSGDGPDYTGQVQVVGSDPYDLDRDGDGIACDV